MKNMKFIEKLNKKLVAAFFVLAILIVPVTVSAQYEDTWGSFGYDSTTGSYGYDYPSSGYVIDDYDFGYGSGSSYNSWSGNNSYDQWSVDTSYDVWEPDYSYNSWSGDSQSYYWSGDNTYGTWGGDNTYGSWDGDNTYDSWSGDNTYVSWGADNTYDSWSGDNTYYSWGSDNTYDSWSGDVTYSSWGGDSAYYEEELAYVYYEPYYEPYYVDPGYSMDFGISYGWGDYGYYDDCYYGYCDDYYYTSRPITVNYGCYDYGCGCSGSNCNYNPPNPPNRDDDVEVRCELSDSTVEEGDYVTISALVYGNDGPFDVEWTGDIDEVDGFDEDDRSQTIRFDDEGTYTFRVEAEDRDGDRDSDTCTVRVEEEDNDDDFRVQCEISDYTVEEGDRITVEVDIDGGDGPFDIEWDGDLNSFEDFDDDERSQRVEVDDDNDIRLEVRVEDDNGNVERDTCRIIRVDDDNDDDEDINVISTTNGDLAGLQSVFLNQVPYTGPIEDAWKVLLFIIILILLSSVVGYAYYRNRQKVAFSESIQSFKQQNRLSKLN